MLHKRKIGDLALFILIIFPSIGDCFNGYMGTKYGVHIISNAYRVSVILASIFFLVFHSVRSFFLFLLFLMSVIFIHMSLMALTTDLSVLDDAKFWFSAIYYIFCLIIFHYLLINNYTVIERVIAALIRYGEIAAVIIFISLIFNIGIPTFAYNGKIYGFGTQSYYIAGNSIGLILVVSLAIASIKFFKNPSYLKIVSILTIYVGAFCIGSRTGMIISSLILVISMFAFIFFKRGNIKYKSIMFIFIIPLFVLIGFKAYEVYNKYSHMLEKADTILDPREKLLAEGKTYLNEQSLSVLLIGRGVKSYTEKFVTYSTKTGSVATAEQDIIDTLGAFGIYGLLVVYSPFIFILVLSSILFFIYRSQYSLYSMIGISLFLGHSVLAGHFIFSAMAVQYAGALMSIAIFELVTVRQS